MKKPNIIEYLSIRDIKENPALFQKKYEKALKKVRTERNRADRMKYDLDHLRAKYNNLMELYDTLHAQDQLKKGAGERLEIHNKMAGIFNRVVQFYPGVTIEAIKGRGKKQEVVDSRHIIMFFLWEKYRIDNRSIGKLLGGRDRTTAIHAIEKIDNLCQSDKGFRNMIDTIRKDVAHI